MFVEIGPSHALILLDSMCLACTARSADDVNCGCAGHQLSRLGKHHVLRPRCAHLLGLDLFCRSYCGKDFKAISSVLSLDNVDRSDRIGPRRLQVCREVAEKLCGLLKRLVLQCLAVNTETSSL